MLYTQVARGIRGSMFVWDTEDDTIELLQWNQVIDFIYSNIKLPIDVYGKRGSYKYTIEDMSELYNADYGSYFATEELHAKDPDLISIPYKLVSREKSSYFSIQVQDNIISSIGRVLSIMGETYVYNYHVIKPIRGRTIAVRDKAPVGNKKDYYTCVVNHKLQYLYIILEINRQGTMAVPLRRDKTIELDESYVTISKNAEHGTNVYSIMDSVKISIVKDDNALVNELIELNNSGYVDKSAMYFRELNKNMQHRVALGVRS